MRKTPFVWLGANRARKWPLGQKALLLDKATSAGLPVPNGAILLDELFQLFFEEGVIEVTETAVTVTDSNWLFDSLYDGIRFPRFNQLVTIRAAFTSLDDVQQSIQSAAKLGIDLNNPDELAAALGSVWSVSPSPQQPFRRDVLVMEMMGGTDVVEGTAVPIEDAAVDQITTQKDSFEIPQLTGFFPRPDSSLPAYAQRLQKLLRGIRRTFGEGSWQVDWLDDGEICWVMKVVECSGK